MGNQNRKLKVVLSPQQKEQARQVTENWERYNPADQSLNLFGSSELWVTVINYKNWNQHLKKLSLAACKLDATGVQVMLDKNWKTLLQLNLRLNNLGSQCIKTIVKIGLPSLKKLQMQSCCLTNESAKFLTKSNWPNILQINLVKNKINFDGFFWFVLSNWKSNQIYANDSKNSGIGYWLITHSKSKWSNSSSQTFYEAFTISWQLREA